MKKIKDNICPQNAVCNNVKNCSAMNIEEIGYGFPIPMIENNKCTYCEKCKAAYLQICTLD